jgi:hypothetical protein
MVALISDNQPKTLKLNVKYLHIYLGTVISATTEAMVLTP